MLTNCEAFNKVLEACRQHRHEFVDEGENVIRFRVRGINYCPLTLAARHYHFLGVEVVEFHAAAKALGLSSEDAAQIVYAADGHESDCGDLPIRSALFEAIQTPNMLPAVVKEHVNAD